MSPVKTLEKEKTSRLEVHGLREDGRAPKNPATVKFTHAAIEALASLGYPIGRYLRSVAAASPDGFTGDLPRVYERMRKTYYQNRTEFLRLKLILQSRLAEVNIEALRVMAMHAQDFSPLWTTRTRAHAALEELKKYL